MINLTLDEQVALLTKDLSGRLPYKVIISYPHTSYISGIPNTRENAVLTGIDPLRREYSIGSKYTRTSGLHIVLRGKILIKPYLRPISSMTEEERKEISEIAHGVFEISEGGVEVWSKEFMVNGGTIVNPFARPYKQTCLISSTSCYELIDWLNKHHFDYRGLIKYGLAIDVTTLEDNPYNDEFIY